MVLQRLAKDFGALGFIITALVQRKRLLGVSENEKQKDEKKRKRKRKRKTYDETKTVCGCLPLVVCRHGEKGAILE